jgi:hypothetical protein
VYSVTVFVLPSMSMYVTASFAHAVIVVSITNISATLRRCQMFLNDCIPSRVGEASFAVLSFMVVIFLLLFVVYVLSPLLSPVDYRAQSYCFFIK